MDTGNFTQLIAVINSKGPGNNPNRIGMEQRVAASPNIVDKNVKVENTDYTGSQPQQNDLPGEDGSEMSDDMAEINVYEVNASRHSEADIPVSVEVVISSSETAVTSTMEPATCDKPGSSGVGQQILLCFPPTPEQSPTQSSGNHQEQLGANQGMPASTLAFQLQNSKIEQNSGNIKLIHPKVLVVNNFTNMNAQNGSSLLENNAKTKAKPKAAVKTLKFPPCVVCSGKASGLHYGVNSCEACKGFFRRYLLRHEQYKCTKGGNCEITNRNRGNCSGCRLKKCLYVGMAKEKSQLGRYTLARRTETIKEVNKLEGKTESDSVKEGNERYPVPNTSCKEEIQMQDLEQPKIEIDFDPDKEMISRNLQRQEEVESSSVSFTDSLIETLVKAMDEIKPFGLSITTDEQLQDALKTHYEKYILKIKTYGAMKSVPKEEFKRLYKDYGIDVDGRMNILRESAKDVEGMIERYCLFAKHVPEFQSLSYRDQSNLLKASRCDFFMILMCEGYSEQLQVFISHTGIGYHIDEAADKFFSRKFITTVCDMYRRWQLLKLSKAEKALLIALTLVFTDRCNLDNHDKVESILLSLVELLRSQLQKTCKSSAPKRFAKIISYLTLMRESSEMYLKEYKELCNDEIIVEEVPMLTEFLLEDW